MTTNEKTAISTAVNSATPAAATQAPKPTSANSILVRMAEKFGVDNKVLYRTLASTCFRKPDGSAPTNEELVSLLIIAEKAGLNPMLGEIYAFPAKAGGIVPIVGINGWRQIAAANPAYAGVRFEVSASKTSVNGIEAPEYISCFVKVRRPDGFVFESEGMAFFEEKFVGSSPAWKSQPRQMLMNKAQIQALKNAFPSCSGLYDEDDATRMNGPAAQSAPASPAPVQKDRKILDAELDKLIALAKARNAWQSATQYVLTRVAEADREYALERISAARASFVAEAQVVSPKALPKEEASVQQTVEPQQEKVVVKEPDGSSSVSDDTMPF